MPNKEEIRNMFNRISEKYDFLNHLLSLGIDKNWRSRLIKLLEKHKPSFILDVATGTADLAIEAMKLNPQMITGIDISEELLKIAKFKIAKKKLENKIQLAVADGENIPFPEKTFNAVIIGFGIRNFENPQKGLDEMYRVLDNNGVIAILEFSKPQNIFIKVLYGIYFKGILPVIGRLVSSSKNAYTYLPESVYAFPHGKEFMNLMALSGFKNIKQIKLSLGIASIYVGKKLNI